MKTQRYGMKNPASLTTKVFAGFSRVLFAKSTLEAGLGGSPII